MPTAASGLARVFLTDIDRVASAAGLCRALKVGGDAGIATRLGLCADPTAGIRRNALLDDLFFSSLTLWIRFLIISAPDEQAEQQPVSPGHTRSKGKARDRLPLT